MARGLATNGHKEAPAAKVSVSRGLGHPHSIQSPPAPREGNRPGKTSEGPASDSWSTGQSEVGRG